MTSVIEEIKSRLNIVDIVGGYLKLEKAGGNFRACCPFHNEKTPSFFISPSRQTYHCFGCSRGGDIISFVEEIEGLDFQGALKVLADRAGVTLTREKTGAKDERAALYTALELATKFYEAVLPKFPEAEAYLKNRGLTQETIKNFRIGFAPDEWRSLGDFLAKKGVSQKVMEQAGLIVLSSQGYYDRFRGRIMFPITDSSGRVIAFSGRILKEGEGKTLGASASAKYVNSPETEVFHKSQALFGFYQAKDPIRRSDACVLVEGQLDLVLSHQAGVTNTVASSGTALTGEHLNLIKRFSKNLILALDADSAGRAATHRAIELALSQEMEVHIVSLPLGSDPGDVAKNDPVGWAKSVSNKMPVIDFYLDLLPRLHKDKMELLKEVTKIIIPFIRETKGVMQQAHYVGQIERLLGIKEESVWDEVKKSERPSQTTPALEKSLTYAVATPRRLRIRNLIHGLLLWQEEAEKPLLQNLSHHRIRLESLEGGPPPPQAPLKDTLVFEAEIRFQGVEKLEAELEELFQNLAEEVLKDKFAAKMLELKRAEEAGNIALAEKLLSECQTISKELHTLTKSNK